MKKKIISCCIALCFSTLFTTSMYAEGTKQLTPIEVQNSSLYLVAANGWGPTFNSSVANRLRFYINDHNVENFYFGAQCRTQGTATFRTDIYYRILDSNRVVVAGPFAMPSSASSTGFINTYDQAVAGPRIGALNPTGYDPIIFDPNLNGEYHIEIYSSNNSGMSSTNVAFILPLFDFSVGTAAGVIPGRLYCQAWSIRATTASDNYNGEFANPVDPVFYAYTPDSTAVKVTFTNFNPLAAIIGFNSYGVNASVTDWSEGRKSVNGQPNLAESFFTFLSLPDSNVFRYSKIYGPPIISPDITGCPGNYSIAFFNEARGDVFINIEQNGIPGYQSGTADLQLLASNVQAGWDTLTWDGLDGLGNPLAPGAVLTVTTIFRRGRVNLPIYDAEWNINGFTLTREKPVFKNNIEMFWDDSELVSYGSGSGGNSTGAGFNNSILGQFSPGRAWNGPYGSTLVVPPATHNGGGSLTPTNPNDDFGNVRTLNTWFFGFDTLSAATTITVSPCLPLPVNSIKLSPQIKEDHNLLLLETDHENNTAYFMLESSLDGISFKDLARTEAKGNTTGISIYPFTVAKEKVGMYYRIRVNDIDGTQYLSNTVFLESANAQNGITVFPNPVNKNLNINFFNDIGFYSLQLVDLYGQILIEDHFEVTSSSFIKIYDRSAISKGLYYLNVKNEDNGEETKRKILFGDF